MEKLELGIIGLGYIGKIHLINSLHIDEINSITIADSSKGAQKLAKELGIKKIYDNYDDLLEDNNVDAVIISLPTHLHANCAVKAAENGKHILLEKPIARNVEEAEQIANICKNNSIKNMMAYPMRFDPIFESQKNEIQSGSLGDVELTDATYLSSGPFFHRSQNNLPTPVPEWWFEKERSGGGVLLDIGCHIINLLRWYYGEITDVQSYLDYRFNLEVEDHAIIIAQFENETTASINLGWHYAGYKLRIGAHGTIKSSVRETKASSLYSKLKTVTEMVITGRPSFYNSHYLMLKHFVDCMVNDIQPQLSIEEGLRDIQIIDATYKNKVNFSK